MVLAAGGTAVAASFGAVETVASTSPAMAWIAVGGAGEAALAAALWWCLATATARAGWCTGGITAC